MANHRVGPMTLTARTCISLRARTVGCDDHDLEVFDWRKEKEAMMIFTVATVAWVPALRNGRDSWYPMGKVVRRPNTYSFIGM